MDYLVVFNAAAMGLTDSVHMGNHARATMSTEEKMALFVYDALCLGTVPYSRWRECLADISSGRLYAPDKRDDATSLVLHFLPSAENALDTITPPDAFLGNHARGTIEYRMCTLNYLLHTYLAHNAQEFADIEPEIYVTYAGGPH